MAAPSFTQARSTNLALPILLAIALLAAAAYAIYRYTPHSTANLTISRTIAWQAHTLFKSDTIMVGRDKAQDDLYILTNLRIDDQLKLPLFLKDFTATLTTADGETLETSGAEKLELDPLYTTFPALKPLASNPLLRDTEVAPGGFAEGMVLLHFPTTKEVWEHRQSAALTVAFYHQPSQTISIPND